MMSSLLFLNFLDLRVADFIDIITVGILFYLLYRLLKGTAAFNIFIGLLLFYVLWKIVVLLHMELLSEILGQFMSAGVVLLIVVFQPEIRKFLLFLGSKNPLRKVNRLIWKEKNNASKRPQINTIIKACYNMGSSHTGALIVITKENKLDEYLQTGEIINAKTSRELIETIFFKNSPLHDGALIITNRIMVAARCILPVSRRQDIPSKLGLRHRAAIGITENTDCVAIIVSEQTGNVSFCREGKIKENVSAAELKTILEEEFFNIKD